MVKVRSFIKDNVSFPTIELVYPDGNKHAFGFTFGLAKARLILANIEDIRKFVEDHSQEGI